MITGELKNRIDGLWDVFAAGGLVNPLDVIEQVTYLMFIRDLDDTDNLRAKEAVMLGLPHKSIFADKVRVGDREIDGNQLKWSVFHDFPAAKMYSTVQEWVFPFIKGLHDDKDSAYSKYMDDAIFKIPTPLMLSKIVDAMDGVNRTITESAGGVNMIAEKSEDAVQKTLEGYEHLRESETSLNHLKELIERFNV